MVAQIETGVVHGRFQVLHHDHLKYILAAKERCRHLVVGITNPDPLRTRDDEADPARSKPRENPLTYYERYQMLRAALLDKGMGVEEFSLVPFPINFPELYPHYLPPEATFFLTIYDEWGEKKFRMFLSAGLAVEVLWRKPRAEKGISSSEVRRRIARSEVWEYLVPLAVNRVMKKMGLVEKIRRSAGQ